VSLDFIKTWVSFWLR